VLLFNQVMTTFQSRPNNKTQTI